MSIELVIFISIFIGGVFGGLSVWYGIRQYRKSLGYNPDPFEPENIYML